MIILFLLFLGKELQIQEIWKLKKRLLIQRIKWCHHHWIITGYPSQSKYFQIWISKKKLCGIYCRNKHWSKCFNNSTPWKMSNFGNGKNLHVVLISAVYTEYLCIQINVKIFIYIFSSTNPFSPNFKNPAVWITKRRKLPYPLFYTHKA